MARPIKEAPILSGKDAERFVWNMYNAKKFSKSYLQRMERAYQKLKRMEDS